MTSATQLTEPEKRELEWESRWEQRKLESQQFDDRWEKMMQQLRNKIFPKPSGEVAVVNKESNLASPIEEVDLQYEAKRQQSEARFHEWRADTNPQTFIPLPQVEGQGFVSLESHDGEWNVQRSTAATDEHSDSHESHEKEGEPIGELFLSCNSTNHDPLEEALTPLQETEELELSIPLPHNWKSYKVNDINSEPYILRSLLEFKDYPRVENYEKESMEFGAQNQGILILPPARENAQLKELVVSLPTPVYCNFASKWLLKWDHKPKVKMKCRVDCVEFYSKFSDNCNSVSLGLLWRCASKLEAGISLVTSIFSKDYFSEILDIGSSRHGMDHIGGLVEQHSNVVEEESTMSMTNVLAFSGKEFGSFRGFSHHLDVDGFMESPNLLGQEVIESKASFESVRKWKNLSNWEKLGNKRCKSKFGAKLDNLGILAKLRGWGDDCWIVVDLVKESKEVSEGVSAVAFYESGVESSKWWSLSKRMPRSLGYDHWESIKEKDDFFLFALLFSQKESLISVANIDSVRLGEGRSSAIPLNSMHNVVVCNCALECNRFEYIKILEVEVVWELLIRFPKPMVKMKLMVTTVDGLGCATYSDNITPSRLKLKLADLISIASTQTHHDNEQWLDGSFKESPGIYTIDIAVLAVGTLRKSLCFWTTRALGYFSKCHGSNGRAAIVLSMFDPMKVVVDCNLKSLRKLSLEQNHYLSLEWLLIWFPKPWVKMRLGKDYPIRSSLYVLFPSAYVLYFPGNSNVEVVYILLRHSEANPNLHLERATTWMQNQLVAQQLVLWVHSSLVVTTWGSSSRKSKLFVFRASSRTMKLKGGGLLHSHYLSWEWLFAWFPRPMVGQEACHRDSLRTRNLKRDGLLRSQIIERKRSSAQLICQLEGHVSSKRNEREGKLRGLNAKQRKGKRIAYKC